MSMLPIPLTKYLPKPLREGIDSAGQALCTYMDATLASWGSETIGLNNLHSAEKCPASFLSELDYYLASDFVSGDTDVQKRNKFLNSIPNHKKRTLWADDVKVRIDNITGLSSDIYSAGVGSDDAIFMGGSADSTFATGAYTMTFGANGIDFGLGIAMIGGGTEPEMPGIVWIDLKYDWADVYAYDTNSAIFLKDSVDVTQHESTFSQGGDSFGRTFEQDYGSGIKPAMQAILNQILANIRNHVPAYYRVFLGYINLDSMFETLVEVT